MNIVDLRAALPTNGTYLTRKNPPRQIVIHHSATEPTRSIRAIADYHINGKGYPGIAYHYCVLADGFVAQTNDDMAVTWHAGCASIHGDTCPDNANTYSIGVCLIGDFTENPPPEKQIAGARALIGVLRRRYGFLPVIGHKEAHGCAYTACPGATWDAWKKELEEVPVSKLGLHFQNLPAWHTDVVNNSAVKWVKMIDPAGPYPYNRPVNVIGRRWIGGEGAEARFIHEGATGADAYFDLLLPRYREAPWVTVWEGPNEPSPYWSDFDTLAPFYLRWTQRMRDAGLANAIGGFSVGQPDWNHIARLRDALAIAPYWHLHEYSQPTMQTDAGVLCLRYRTFVNELRKAGCRVPKLIISETGIDGGAVTPERESQKKTGRGWKSFATREQYQEQLAWYDAEICKDDYVACATAFLSGPNDGWRDFDVDEGLARWICARHSALPIDVERALGDAMQAHIVPLNPSAAFEQAGAAQGLLPAGEEFDCSVNGIIYRCQAYRSPGERGWQYGAYTEVGNWSKVRWFKRSN